MRTLKNNKPIFKVNEAEGIQPSYSDKKIIAVDFDGTLVHNRYPFCENPNIELINFIKEHRNDYIWILWTCRHGEQLNMAVRYMREEHQVSFDFINQNAPWLIEEFGDTRKIFADIYIDDKASNDFYKAGEKNDIQ